VQRALQIGNRFRFAGWEMARRWAAFAMLPHRKVRCTLAFDMSCVMHCKVTDFADEERAALPPVPPTVVRLHPGSRRKSFAYERPLRAISGRSRMRVYSILALLPVETDGRLRNRIKSNEENFERIVIEDSLSRLN
jgi:hypothetical protein